MVFLFCAVFGFGIKVILVRMNWEVLPPLLFSETGCIELALYFQMQVYFKPLFESCHLLSHWPRHMAAPPLEGGKDGLLPGGRAGKSHGNRSACWEG